MKILYLLIVLTFILSCCSGGNNAEGDVKNRGQRKYDAEHKSPRNNPRNLDTTKNLKPQPNNVPIEDENHEVKWI